MGTKEQLLRLLEDNRERHVSGAAMAKAIGVSRNADRRLVSILDRCVQYTAESKMTTWLSQSSLAVHPISFRLLAPVSGAIHGRHRRTARLRARRCLYVSHVKLRAARRVEDFSFTDPLTEGWSLARFRSEVGAQMATPAMALTPSCTST